MGSNKSSNLRKMITMSNGEKISKTKEDQDIHEKALEALTHYYKHRDSGFLTRIILNMPNSNRRVAMLRWIQEFSVLRWDRNLNKLVRSKIPEFQNFGEANQQPFWTFKIKQEQRRHTSGNTFESDLFFDRVISDIKLNINEISMLKLEKAILDLLKILEEKRNSLKYRENFISKT